MVSKPTIKLLKAIIIFVSPLITAISLIMYYSGNQRNVCCDAYTYVAIASTMNIEGIWSQHDSVYIRTYLYPFLLSLNNKSSLQNYKEFAFIYSNQTIALLIIIYTVVIALLNSGKSNKAYLIVFACLFNPLTLVYVPVTLTESYTIFCFAFLLSYLVWMLKSIQNTLSSNAFNASWPMKILAPGILSGLLVMLRPANLVVAIAAYLTIILYIWLGSVHNHKNLKTRIFLVLDKTNFLITVTVLFATGFLFAVFPQIIINIKYFDKFSFFPFVDLAKSQYFWGLQNFKYGTLVRESALPLPYSTSGYLADISAYSDSPLTYYVEHPLSGIILLISHVYNSLNVDFLYTYINENEYTIISWHQLLSSLITITGLLGVVLMMRSLRGNFVFNPSNTFLLLCLVGFCILNAFIAVEVRFGLIPIISLTYFGLIFFVDYFKLMELRTKLAALSIIILYMLFSAYASFYFVSVTGAFSTSWF